MAFKLSNEQALTIMLSRITFSKSEIALIAQLMKQDINWVEFFNYALINKTVGLVYHNIVKHKLFPRWIKPTVLLMMRSFYNAMAVRNKILLESADEIQSKMNAHGIRVIPLKGITLLKEVYLFLGARSLNDLDFLCSYKDIKSIATIMNSIGYIEGEYDWNQKEIHPFSRKKKLLWKSKMNNLPTYIKKNDNLNVEIIEVDFSISLDLKRNFEVMDKIFVKDMQNDISVDDFLLHLCCHLFKEAEGDIWIAAAADINLIKFCDIREYYICNRNQIFDERLIDRSVELECSNALYYSMYYLHIIYNDDFSENILKLMNYKSLSIDKTRLSCLDFSDEEQARFYKRVFTYKNANNISDVNFATKQSAFDEL